MIPGRIFASFALAVPLFAQYAGPAILSRGDAPTGIQSAPVTFRPFFEIAAIYDTGLTGVGAASQGELGGAASEGVQFSGGISGNHSWRHTSIGLNYRGDINHFAKDTNYDNSDQSLFLSVRHQFSRHVYLNLRESAGMLSTAGSIYGLQEAIAYDPAQSTLPTTDFFDNRTVYLSSQADVLYQRTAKLSFDFGGDAFLNRHRSTDLDGVTGLGARGDMQYRISRRSTIGANYSFTNYRYTRFLSGTFIHTFSGTFAYQLSRRLEFTVYGGVSHVDSKIEEVVAVNPAIAAILGITAGLVVSHTITTVPSGSGRISETFHGGVLYAGGGHTVTPGNGLFNTSITTNASAGYTYTGVRRWSLAATANYSNSNAVGIASAKYGLTSGALTATRQIAKTMHMILAININRYSSPQYALYNRTEYSAKVGFGWTPGDVPLRVW